MLLRRGTTDTFRVGPFLNTSGIVATTALTISSADVKLSKDGAAFLAKGAVGGGTHDADGWYSIDLSTADTGTLGKLQVSVQNASALPVWHELMILPENVYDSLISDTALLFVDSTILNNSSHGNAALQVTIDAIKAETTLIHAETTAMSTILANSSHGNANLFTVLTSVHDETTKMSTVLDNSSHGNANLLVVLSSVKSETTAIHAESTKMSTILDNSSHGNAALLARGNSAWITSTLSATDIWTAATRTLTALPGTVSNLDDLQANILGSGGTARDLTHLSGPTFSTATDSLEAVRDRGDTAWITASGFSTVTPSTVVSLSTAGVAAVHNELIEGTLSARDIQKINLAVLAGESTGGGTTQVKFKGQTTTIDRVTANLSSVQNRVSVTISTA